MKNIQKICNEVERTIEDHIDNSRTQYSDDGIYANVSEWANNKGALIDLLRKSPYWSEEDLAIVFDINESRADNPKYIMSLFNRLINTYMGEDEAAMEHYSHLENQVEFLDMYYLLQRTDQFINEFDEEAVARAKTLGIKINYGQKRSRALAAFFKHYGLDKFDFYKKHFCELADALNPIQMHRKAILSVNPVDYLLMSNGVNGWRSCHNIYNGCYMAGTLSYMNDAVSMVFYTVDESVTSDYAYEPKINREMFYYSNGVLIQSRLYPQDQEHDETFKNEIRDLVQRLISECEGKPNLWHIKRGSDAVCEYCGTRGLHYPDYEYSQYNPVISFNYAFEKYDTMWIGNEAYCINCGRLIEDSEKLNCDECDFVECEKCGCMVSREDAIDIGGYYYCPDCVVQCDECGEYVVIDDSYTAHVNNHEVTVCDSCLEYYYVPCEECGEYFRRNSINEVSVNGDCVSICDDCLESTYYRCEECDEYVHCKDVVEIDGCYYCESCADDIRAEKEKEESEAV